MLLMLAGAAAANWAVDQIQVVLAVLFLSRE